MELRLHDGLHGSACRRKDFARKLDDARGAGCRIADEFRVIDFEQIHPRVFAKSIVTVRVAFPPAAQSDHCVKITDLLADRWMLFDGEL